MGLVSGLVKAGIAKKVLEQARRPENQAKAKDLFRSVRGKSSSGQPPTR